LSASYCGRKCQVADWKSRHGRTCARLPKPLLAVKLRLIGGAERPCKHLTEASALCSRAEARNENGEDAFEGFYRHPPAAREDLGAFLKGLGPDVAVDDALFVQLVAAALGRLGPESGPLVFAVGGLAPWLLLERALSTPAKLMPGYFAPTDSDAFELARRPPRPGGRWLAGPDSKGRFLGMAPGGPARLPLSAWHELILRGLRDGVSDPTSPLSPEARQQIQLHLAIDDLEYAGYRLYRQPPGVQPISGAGQ
jgi:hypothetical protein